MDSPPTQVATAEARIALLEARIAELEAEPAGDAPRSRRQLLRLAGAAVVGTVAATTAAGKAAADDSFNTFMPGNPIDFNTPDVTRINYVGLEGEAAAFLFQGGLQYVNTESGVPAVLAGWATANQNLLTVGVYGYSDFGGTGRGVVGSCAAVGVEGIGATGVSANGTTTGVATAGNTFGVDATANSEDGAGVRAVNTLGPGVVASGARQGLIGAATSTSTGTIGVQGLAQGVGVQGEGSTGLVGVGTNTGLDAVGSVVGVRAAASSVNGTAMYLAAQVGHLAPAARAATYTRGQVEMDENGNLWLCTATGTPGTWRKLAGPATAGAFHALTPGRVTDSRPTQGGSGPLDVTGTVTVSVANRMAVGVVPPLADFVPAGATAVTANVTVTNTVGTGYLAVNPGGTTSVAASTINWVGTGLNLANGVTLTLNANRELTVICGGQPGAQANFIIDITGYYR